MEIRAGNYDGEFGPNYAIKDCEGGYDELLVSRNNKLDKSPIIGSFYFEIAGETVAIDDHGMQELFMAYMAMRQEYETGEEINYDEGTGT